MFGVRSVACTFTLACYACFTTSVFTILFARVASLSGKYSALDHTPRAAHAFDHSPRLPIVRVIAKLSRLRNSRAPVYNAAGYRYAVNKFCRN